INVQRRAVELQGTFEALDGHVDAGAEAARVRQDDLHVSLRCRPAYPTAGRRAGQREQLASLPHEARGDKRQRHPGGGVASRNDVDLPGRGGGQSNLTSLTVMTFLPSFSSTVPVTVPFLASVQIALWFFLLLSVSK